MKNSIIFNNLTLGYNRHPAVHHLDGEIEKGTLLAIVGPNGAGKSTLLKGIMDEIPPLSGKIERSINTKTGIAYLPQSNEIERSFPISVYDMVAMGLWKKHGILGSITRKKYHKIEEAIAAVGLTGFENRTLSTLSGGQMQRVLFARLLLQDAEIILLDEPFTAIDTKTTSDLLHIVQRWHQEQRTIIAVLHDLDLVKKIFPQTLLIARKIIAWGPTASTLKPQNLLQARRMIEAFDDHAKICASHV